MKNFTKIFTAVALTAIMLTSCSNSPKKEDDKSGPEEIKTMETRRVPLYLNISIPSPTATLNVQHFNNSDVGYFEADYFASSLFQNFKFETKYDGYNYIIKNSYTNAICTVDFYNQTISYSNYDAYIVTDLDFIPYMDCLISGGKQYFITPKSSSIYEASSSPYTIYVKKDYNIPLYFNNNLGYLPIDLYAKFIAPFLDLAVFYNGTSIYFAEISNFGVDALKKFKNEGNIFSKEYMEYTYNLLAIQLDNCFGMDCRDKRLGGSEKFKYLDGNIYDILKPYHDGLTSLDTNVADTTYWKLFAEQIDDGGHSGFSGFTCLCDENKGPKQYGDDIKYGWEIGDKLEAKRKEAKYDPIYVIEQTTGIADNGSKHCYTEIGDTAFLTFDEFVAPDKTFSLPITINNYWKDTIGFTSYANEQIRSNSNIKHVVVDLSCNGGGSSIAETFIASWLCNGVTTKTLNPVHKTYSEQTHYADVNFDGVYDEKDYLSPDIDVSCITSRVSFSCGNLLAFHLKELRNAKLIGARSGGGSCEVMLNVPTGLGNTYRLSKMNQLGSDASTGLDNFISVEDGVTPTFYPISYEENDIGKFYDRQTIVDKIHQA